MEYGCIAEKLGHSFSKDIHNRLFDYKYELCEISKDSFDKFMTEKNFKAINVTIPYKESVIKYLDFISETAEKIGAVNTIVNENGYLRGYNTDFFGMVSLIEKNGISIKGRKVLVLGSGGTSKTAKAVAEYLGCSCVYRVSRTGKNGCITYEEALNRHLDSEIIINTTPVGMYPNINVAPVNIDNYKNVTAVVDAVYNPLRSKLVIESCKMGIRAVGGLYMLVAQAALAAEKFTGIPVPTSEIDRVYSEILIKKQNIVLTGMPGSGKTTIGKRLAADLDLRFIDVYELIVEKTKKSISGIFGEIGEVGFRKIESEAISEISSVQGAVIATGGGAVLDIQNIDLLKENGKIYFIDRDINEIAATSDRPLSSNRKDLEKRYSERYDIYCERCDRHIKINNSIEDNVERIKKDYLA